VLGASATTASDFHQAWLISVVGGLTAGLALAAIGPPVRRAAGAPTGEQPLISEPIADPLIVEPLVIEDAA
jgi:hypothetical protein